MCTKAINDCHYQDWKIRLLLEDGRPQIQVEFEAPDSKTGEPKGWVGRRWRLSFLMTRSEIVTTVFKAIMTAVEHETRENFKYRGRAIFGPHFNVDRLWALAGKKGAEEHR